MMVDQLNKVIKEDFKDMTENISDGYHTFGELYKHRIVLYIALCQMAIEYGETASDSNGTQEIFEKYKSQICAKSKKHDDGSEMEGWFIMQLETPEGQISYHLPNEYWDRCNFAVTLEKANKWDGHTSDDVLDRLLKI